MNKYLQTLAYIVVLSLLILVGTGVCLNVAHAQTSASNISSIDVSKLTSEQKTELLAKTVELQKQATNPANMSATLRNEATQWADLGTNLGKATVAAAKEVGLAANDFAQTPLGKITIAIVVYKIIGSNLLHLVYGFLILGIGFSITGYFLLKNKYLIAEYDNIPVLGGLYVRKVTKKCQTSSDNVTSHWAAAAVTAIITLIVGTLALFSQ